MNPELQIIGQFNADARREFPIVAFIGARWQFADKWTMLALFPKPRIEYQATDALAVYAGAGFYGAGVFDSLSDTHPIVV